MTLRTPAQPVALPMLPPVPPAGPAAFHVLAKPTGAVCNLDCEYCFYLSKQMLYPGSRFRMADELLERYVRQLVEAHAGAPDVDVAWQGGEPTLMGLPFFERAVGLVERHLQPGQTARYTIQTNGTRLDAAWAAFFREHDVLVGISIDGPRELHDTYRVTKGGRGSFDQVMRGLGHLRAGGVEVNLLSTVNAANERRGREVYRFLREQCGARFIQFIPIVERTEADGPGVSDASVSAGGYGRFLVDVFEDWVRRDVGEVYVQLFDATLANRVGEAPGLCVHCETCGDALALEHTGDVFACDHFVDDAHRLGNITERHLRELVALPRQREFGRAKRDTLPRQCVACELRSACHGGCPKDRFVLSSDGDPGLNYLCPSFTRFFAHVGEPMGTMAALLARGRAPAEIMRAYAAGDARRGRNEACPCGSGRKWKHCHGAAPGR